MARSNKLAGIVGAFSGIMRVFLEAITPELRKIIKESLARWEKVAAETPNYWDDLVVDAAQALFGFKDDE